MKKGLLFLHLLFANMIFSQGGDPGSITPIAPDDYTHHPQSYMKDGIEKVPGNNIENDFNADPDEIHSLVMPPVQLFDTVVYWKLDTSSNEWVFKSRNIDFLYDERNNLKSVTTQKWDGFSWIDSIQINRTYDDSDHMTYVVVSKWVDSLWVNSYNNIHTYENNNHTSIRVQGWDSIHWVNSFQELYSYIGDKLDVWTRQKWNIDTKDWDNDWQYLYTYDPFYINRLSELKRFYAANQWWNSYQHLYAYDASDNLTSDTTIQWIGSGPVKKDLIVYTYDTNHNVLSLITMKWKDGDWMNVSRQLSTYDSNSNKLFLKVQSWNSTWTDSDSLTYTYDNDNNLITVLYQKWDTDTVAWTNFRQQALSYGANHTLLTHDIWSWNETGWVISAMRLYRYDEFSYLTNASYRSFSADGTYFLRGDSTAYYFMIIAKEDYLVVDNQVLVYPNPSSGRFTVSTMQADAVDVYTMTGRRVYRAALNKYQTSVEIDLAQQGAGMYIVVLHTGSMNYTCKILVQ